MKLLRLLTVLAVIAAFAWLIGRAVDVEQAQGSGRAPAAAYAGETALPDASSSELVQGKDVHWWAHRAVQARKDANARARTIRRLQSVVRGRLALPTGHWLDGAFLCIHRFERGAAGWQTATGNGYHGGLQMDASFQRAHGGWALEAFGPAERWPASVQIAVAIQAWTTRGFGPWPTTRHYCGL